MRTKALEWVKHPHANLWRADCLTGRYQVYAITSPITWGFDGFDGLTEVFGESPTEEAAKAAAQSHFDAAIASVLEDDGWERKRAIAAIHWVFSADGTVGERAMAQEAIHKINDPTFLLD
jgi:hypothetical protein